MPKDSFVYCCFNKHYKITPQIFDLWIDILNSVNKSVLWLNSTEEETKKNSDKFQNIYFWYYKKNPLYQK